MADHVARPNGPATSQDRVAELHRLAREDYASTAHLRNAPRPPLSYPASAALLAVLRDEPTDLDVAISVAQQVLDSDQVLSLREALRLLLRALGADRGEGQ